MKKVLLQWLPVDEIRTCLIFENGDPKKEEDRVAIIEKSPRVLINGQWIEGQKGKVGSIHLEGYTVYGYHQPSRDWCEKLIKENYETISNEQLVKNFVLNSRQIYDPVIKRLFHMTNSNNFFKQFYFSADDLKYLYSRTEQKQIHLPAIEGKDIESFLKNYDLVMLKFRENLLLNLEREVKKLDSLDKIQHRHSSGIICLDGNNIIQTEKNLLSLFQSELKETPIAIMYKGVLQNDISSNNVVIVKYSKSLKRIVFIYKNCEFVIDLTNYNTSDANFGHSLRKVLKQKNFYNFLYKLILQQHRIYMN